MIHFTSDPHFWHSNIIEYCRRPFKDAAQMNEVLVSKWRERVHPEDTVYVLGDVGFCGRGKLELIMSCLPGHKHLILGNHDYERNGKPKKETVQFFETVNDYLQISVSGQEIHLFHYPVKSWPNMEKGSWLLYGHVHGGEPWGKSIDVGVDAHDFAPVSFDEVERIMSNQPLIRGGLPSR